MKKSTITILGSSSHIAKGLIYNFLKSREFHLNLYSRSNNKIKSFLKFIGKLSSKDYSLYENYENFAKINHEVIINCIGVGTLNKLKGNYSNYFMVAEEYDNLIINYLCKNPKTLYISFSSGAVYGKGLEKPAENNTKNCINVNHVTPEEYYSIARLNSEAKHRSFTNLNIVDLRIFSYFSRFIDLSDNYFITEILDCIFNKKEFITNNLNFVRDYLHPDDLYRMIRKCIELRKINAAFDVISKKPTEKKEIIGYFSQRYNLKYKIEKSMEIFSPTGTKKVYCSNYNNASSIGFRPKFSSIDTIKEESNYILDKKNISL